LYNRGWVFTAQYTLNPYIKQTRLIFKGLILATFLQSDLRSTGSPVRNLSSIPYPVNKTPLGP